MTDTSGSARAAVPKPRSRHEGSETPANEMLSGIPAIRHELFEAIKEAQGERPDGANMPMVGVVFRQRVGVPFEQFVTFQVLQNGVQIPNPKRKMLSFIQDYMSDQVEAVIRENGTATAKVIDEPPIAPDMPVYQKSVWVAFIRPIKVRSRRFLKLDEHVGFTDLPVGTQPQPQWVEVLGTDTVGASSTEQVDTLAVHRAIQAWLERTGTDLSKVVVRPSSAGISSRLQQLLEIIEGLPSDVAARWEIPATVLLHLKD